MFSVSPIGFAYSLLAFLGLVLVVTGVLLKRTHKNKTILDDMLKNHGRIMHTGFLDSVLDKIPYIVEQERKFSKKIAMLDLSFTARDFTKQRLAFGIIGLAMAVHLENFLASIPLLLITTSLPTVWVEMRVNRRINLYESQVQEAFQLFITDYTTTRSITHTVELVSQKLNDPLRREFERLSRKFNSGEKKEDALMEFAERTQNKWMYIFAQMLINYLRTGGDFTPHAMGLINRITSESILIEKNSTELSGLRGLNILVNAAVPVAYVLNLFMNPDASRVFIDTSTGQWLIFGVITGSFVSLWLGKKISDARG